MYKTIAYEEGNATAGQLKEKNVDSEGLFVGGASQPQNKVDDCQIVHTYFFLTITFSLYYSDQFKFAKEKKG